MTKLSVFFRACVKGYDFSEECKKSLCYHTRHTSNNLNISMRFPTFLAVFLLAAIVVAVPFVSAAVERERDNVERSRPGDGQVEQPPRAETPTPERDEENQTPQGGVVYSKNGVVVYVDETPNSTIVTVSVDGKIASKVTHSGSTDNNNGGNNSAPGQDGADGSDGDDNSGTPGNDDAEGDDNRGREDRGERVR